MTDGDRMGTVRRTVTTTDGRELEVLTAGDPTGLPMAVDSGESVGGGRLLRDWTTSRRSSTFGW